jgi:hypothetical protein
MTLLVIAPAVRSWPSQPSLAPTHQAPAAAMMSTNSPAMTSNAFFMFSPGMPATIAGPIRQRA